MIKKLMFSTASFGATLALAGGITFASSITYTGPHSKNIIKYKDSHVCKSINNNNVELSNSSSQNSNTGKAKVSDNTSGGNSLSGDALNANGAAVDLTLSNNQLPCVLGGVNIQTDVVGGASIDHTGPHSYNLISTVNVSKVKSTNNNNLSISNSTLQCASSGNATVTDNTTGGNATSGNATNSSSSSFNISVSNN